MSLDITSESSCVCYVHCNFCSTILAVSVPWANICTIVTVRCGHCANLLSVNMGAFIHTLPFQEPQTKQKEQANFVDASKDSGSSSKCNNSIKQPPQMPPILPPEKRQRVPSAYNRFIKEEIQRIKASNPHISHREAFSTAAKNWAHFPHIHFGLNLESNRQGTVDMPYGE